MFAGAVKAISLQLKKHGKELLIGSDNSALINDLCDVLGRIERQATPIQKRPRARKQSQPRPDGRP